MAETIHPLLATVEQKPDTLDTVDISDIEFSPNENPLDVSFKAGVDKEPERVAATIKTARSLNQPPEVVEKNFEAAKQAASRPSSDYFADIIKDNPRVAKFLSDPQAMALTKDDIPSLTDFDDVVKESLRSLNPANFPGASPEDYQRMSSDLAAGWKSGRLNVRQAQIGWQRLLETIQTGEWSQFGEEDLANIEKENLTQPPPPKGFAPFYFAGQQLPNFALMAEKGVIRAGQAGAIGAGGAALASALTGPGAPAVGAVTVPAATIGGLALGGRIGVAEASAILEGGLAFDEFSKLRDVNGKQIDARQAASMALGVGVVNAGLEYASAAALLRTIPGGQKILGLIGNKSIFKNMTPGIAVREAAKKYLESLGTEIATELAQETTVVEGGNLLKQLSGEPFEPTPPGAQLARVLSVISPTAQATGLMGLPGSAIHIVSDVQSMNRANKAQEVYNALQNQASKLRERDPVMHEEHVADVVKGTPVETIYVDARAAQTYFQAKNIDLNALASEFGLEPDKLRETVERGGDIEIPYATWNAKLGATDHYAALAGDVKFDPNERTINQAASKAAETRQLLVDQAQNVAAEDPKIASGMEFIYNDIKTKMKLSGAYKEDKQGEALLDANARVFAAAIVNLPDRGARDPKEFYQQMIPVEVAGAQASPEGALQQAAQPAPPVVEQPETTVRKTLLPGQTEQFIKQTETEQFKKFFGKSALVDANGSPMVVFHGTRGDFTNFKFNPNDIGIHVGTSAQATDRIQFPRYDFFTSERDAGKNIKPLYARIENPVEMPDLGTWSLDKVKDQFREMLREIKDETDFQNGLSAIDHIETMQQARNYLKDLGYDGIKYVNRGESLGGAALYNREFEAGARFIRKFGFNPDNLSEVATEDLIVQAKKSPEYKEWLQASNERQDAIGEIADYSYIVLDPTQLKSATGNIGTFNRKKHSILLQGTPDEPRGFIDFTPEKTLIGVLKADASTFVHETAHFWLKNFAAFVDAGGATEKHLADWKILSQWLKIPEGKFNLSVEQQEKFARGFEAYLREGVAPSEGLRLAFRRFARWLTKLYRDIRQLNVDLNDDMRGVMDRMLASEDEIAFARRHMGLDLVPDLTGIDPGVIAKLTNLREEAHDQAVEELLQKQMRELKPERRERYNAELEKARKQARADVMQMPEYVAAEAIQRSSMKVKNANAAALAFTDKTLLPKDRISFRMIAQMQGFSSPQALAKKLLALPTVTQEVNRRVQFAMQQFADLKDTDKIKEEAVAALANERQTELLAYERAMFLALIDQAQNNAQEIRTRRADAKIEADAAKAKATELIAKTPVNKAISFMPYFTAERNAATEAYIAAKAGQFEKAADAKRRQMLNHALATEAFRARQAIEKWRGYLHDVQLKDKALFKREEHFNQVSAILARFGIERGDYDPAKRTETLQAWADRMIEQEAAVNIPDWLMDESISIPSSDLTVTQMRDVVDALKNIQHIANKENTFYRVMAGATIENTVLDLSKEAAANNTANPAELIERRRGWFEKAKRFLRGYDSQLRTAENVALKMGGWKDNSLWYRVLWRSAETAGNAESELLRPLSEEYAEVLKKHYTDKERAEMVDDDEQIFIPEWNQSVRKISLVMMALNLGTQSNRDRLFESRIVGVDPAIAWGPDEVVGVLSKQLTSKDMAFVQDIWNMINKLWPQMSDVHKEVTGFSPEKVDSLSFTINTADGKLVAMDGGYFPLKADTRANLLTEIRERLDAPLYTEQNPAFVASTKTGHLKARVKQAKYPVALEISTIQRHIQDAVHDIAWRPTIIDLRRLVNNQGFRQLMLTYGTAEDYSALRDWVGSAAAGNQKEQAILSFWDTTMRALKNNFTGAVIVLNPKIVFQNVSNIFLYAGSVEGFGWSDVVSGMMQKGLAYDVASLTRADSANRAREFVYGKSSFMADKKESPDYSLNDMADAMFGKKHNVRNFFKGAMSSFDELTSIPMWTTAYEKGVATGKTEAESIEFADNMIRRSIGATRKHQTAGIFRSGETAKTFAILYGFMSAQKNRWERERGILGKDYIANSPRFLGYLFSHFIVFAAMSQIMSGNVPDFDDPDKLKRWLKSILLYRFQMEPGIGAIANVVADNAFGLNSFGYRPIPQVAVPEKIILAASKTISAAKGDTEYKDAAEAITHALTFSTGTPDQLMNWFWNLFDIAVEGMEPKPGDLLRRRPASER